EALSQRDRRQTELATGSDRGHALGAGLPRELTDSASEDLDESRRSLPPSIRGPCAWPARGAVRLALLSTTEPSHMFDRRPTRFGCRESLARPRDHVHRWTAHSGGHAYAVHVRSAAHKRDSACYDRADFLDRCRREQMIERRRASIAHVPVRPPPPA